MLVKMKDSGVVWIGEVPSEWDIIKIKHPLKERKEKNYPKKTDNILSLLKDRGVIPYDEKGDIGNKSKDNIEDYKLAYPNDIVLNSMNIIIGSVGLSRYFGAVSPVYYTLYNRYPDNSIEYFNYIFQTEQFQKSLIGFGNGILAHRMRIPMQRLNTFMIPYPAKSVQHSIASYLNQEISLIDCTIYKTNELIKEYRNYMQSLITETVLRGLNPHVKMKDSIIAWIRNIPSHWEIRLAKHVLTKLQREKKKNGNTVICSNTGKSKLLNSGDRTGLISLTQHDYQGVEVGDLLIHGMDTWHGAIALSMHEGDCTSVVHVCDSRESKTYISYFLKMLAIMNVYKVISNGVRQNTSDFRSWSKVGEIEMLIPPIEEQEKIGDFLDKKIEEIERLIYLKEKTIVELDSYKKALIYECVTGKKEVK